MQPRIIAPSSPSQQLNCTCCGKPLRGSTAWLELDMRSNTYHDSGDVPADKSQGWFPFGLACARITLRHAVKPKGV